MDEEFIAGVDKDLTTAVDKEFTTRSLPKRLQLHG